MTSLDETARRPVETQNDRRISDECPEEDIAAAEFRGSNLLHLPWFLDVLKDRVLYCCHALLCIASLCVLRTCVHFAIVYRASP